VAVQVIANGAVREVVEKIRRVPPAKCAMARVSVMKKRLQGIAAMAQVWLKSYNYH
jgi:hypothetical protein